MEYLHTMIRVTELEPTLDFFCKKLNMVETRRIDNAQGRFTLVFLAASGDAERAKTSKTPLIEITYNWDKEIYQPSRHFGHLAYQVDNIYETCQALIDKGVTILRPPRDGYMAFIKAPDGTSIELLQKGDRLPPTEPWTSMENIGSW